MEKAAKAMLTACVPPAMVADVRRVSEAPSRLDKQRHKLEEMGSRVSTIESLSLFREIVKNHCKLPVRSWFFGFSLIFDFSVYFNYS